MQNLDEALNVAVKNFVAKRPKTLALHDRAKVVMPGGNTRTVLFSAPFPIRIERAEGAMLHDVDGHVYLDFLGEYSAGIYGHSHPRIMAAISEAVSGGLNMGAHHAREIAFAEAVTKRFELERLRFTNSGTEANMMALAAARCFTKREKIMPMMGGYHGGSLYYGSGASPVNAPFECVLGRFNDIEVTRDLIRKHSAELAAVIVEPMLGSGGCIPASIEFLTMLRVESSKAGIVLIFDEVMTSRLHPNGYSAKIGIQPDMKTLGKYIGGGMSFGAFGGLAEIMDMFDPMRPDALPHAGTFNNNVLTMTVGLAGLTEIYTPEVCIAHCAIGEKLKTDLNDMFMRYQAPMQVTGIGTLLNIHMVTGDIVRAEDAKGDVRIERLLYHHLLDDGIYIAERGFIALSILVGEKEIARLVGVIERFILRYRSLLVG